MYFLFRFTLWEKSEISPLILKDDFRELQTRYKDYQQFHTDWPKKTHRLSVLLYRNMQRIPVGSSTFTAVAKAVDLALDFKVCISGLYVVSCW